jgi:hypothetical protein
MCISRANQGAWRMARDESGWGANLYGFEWEEPAGLNLRERSRQAAAPVPRRVGPVPPAPGLTHWRTGTHGSTRLGA